MEYFYPIRGYEGHYSISKSGVVKSENRIVTDIDGWKIRLKGKVIKKFISTPGYMIVKLTINGKPKQFQVHRLVADTFIGNIYNHKYVNHIDENKLNNHVDNLEWCDAKYNSNHGTARERISRSKRKNGRVVCQYDSDVSLVATYSCYSDSVEGMTRAKSLCVNRCLNHQKNYKTAHGYKWIYADELLHVKVR